MKQAALYAPYLKVRALMRALIRRAVAQAVKQHMARLYETSSIQQPAGKPLWIERLHNMSS